MYITTVQKLIVNSLILLQKLNKEKLIEFLTILSKAEELTLLAFMSI